jgi:4-carboxymuconolactone decarboxylase
MQSDPDRRARDDRKIQEILGQKAEQVERPLGGIAPDPATYVLEKIMMQLVPFVGVATAINGTAACREVFAAAGQDTG